MKRSRMDQTRVSSIFHLRKILEFMGPTTISGFGLLVHHQKRKRSTVRATKDKDATKRVSFQLPYGTMEITKSERFLHIVGRENEIRDRSCTHGGPSPDGSADLHKMLASITECLHALCEADRQAMERRNHHRIHSDAETRCQDLTTERSNAQIRAMLQFWSDRGEEINPSYHKLCFSMATDATLDDNLQYARKFMQMGLILSAWCIVPHLEEGFPTTSSASLDEKVNEALGKPMIKTRTDRGMIRFLSKQTPCRCLDQLVTQTEETPRPYFTTTKHQDNNNKKVQLLRCRRHKMHDYGSKHSHKKDWKLPTWPWFATKSSAATLVTSKADEDIILDSWRGIEVFVVSFAPE